MRGMPVSFTLYLNDHLDFLSWGYIGMVGVVQAARPAHPDPQRTGFDRKLRNCIIEGTVGRGERQPTCIEAQLQPWYPSLAGSPDEQLLAATTTRLRLAVGTCMVSLHDPTQDETLRAVSEDEGWIISTPKRIRTNNPCLVSCMTPGWDGRGILTGSALKVIWGGSIPYCAWWLLPGEEAHVLPTSTLFFSRPVKVRYF